MMDNNENIPQWEYVECKNGVHKFKNVNTLETFYQTQRGVEMYQQRRINLIQLKLAEFGVTH